VFFRNTVLAEECTDEMLQVYVPNANNVYLEYVATSNPDTYKIYVHGLSIGLSYDGINGTAFEDGYYAYATAGDTFSIVVRVSDGSACALRDIKTVSITLPTNTVGNNEPVIEENTENVSTGNNTSIAPSDNSNSSVVTTNSSSNTTTNGDSTTDNTVNESSNINDEATVKDNSDEATVKDTNTEVEVISVTKDKNRENNNYIKYGVIMFSVTIFIGILIYIYLKRIRRHK
jgi:hypothetical protein